MDLILSVKGLTVRYSNSQALTNFSADLYRGDFVVLLGPNGSGKSTILRSFVGFVKPTDGSIMIFGTDATDGIGKRIRKDMGYVPQAHNIDPRAPFRVEDVVAIGRFGTVGIGKRLSSEDRKLIQRSMKDTGITHLSGRPIGHLSGGERQKVQIARALCQTPQILLLDEPTAHIDLRTQDELMELFKRLHEEQGITIVLVMHDIHNLPTQCNRSIIVSEGRKIYDGDAQGISPREILSRLNGARSENRGRKTDTADGGACCNG
jgi:ABC-type cobalamin/Fe3+-siderophores transport system ATPase subunit